MQPPDVDLGRPRRSERLLLSVPRSRALGAVAAAGAVAATTVLILPLRETTPAVSTGVLYLVAVLLHSVLTAAGHRDGHGGPRRA